MTDVLSRRQLLERAAKGGAVLTLPGLLAACGGSEKSSSGGDSGDNTLAKTLRFSNWTLYIDIDEKTKKRPTLEEFKKKFGVDVQYTEDINSNAQYFGKIQGPLSRGQSINRDLAVLTDNERFLSLMIDKGWTEKLDKEAIPNIKNLVQAQRHPPFDKNRDYSLPWASGMTGIAYNAKLTSPITSMDQLLEDKKLKGRVTLLDDLSDTLGLVMLSNGDDPSKVTEDDVQQGARPRQGGRRLRSGPPVHRQRLQRPAGEGRPDGGRRLVRRHRAAPGRQPEPEVEDPEGRRDDLDRQHDHPEGRRRVHGVRVHELRLRPEGGGEARGVHQLRHAGDRREGRAREDRSGTREERADLPDREDARRRCTSSTRRH